eukprot:3691694-Rhodomonas_salina.1
MEIIGSMRPTILYPHPVCFQMFVSSPTVWRGLCASRKGHRNDYGDTESYPAPTDCSMFNPAREYMYPGTRDTWARSFCSYGPMYPYYSRPVIIRIPALHKTKRREADHKKREREKEPISDAATAQRAPAPGASRPAICLLLAAKLALLQHIPELAAAGAHVSPSFQPADPTEASSRNIVRENSIALAHEEQKQVWSSCVAAARAEYVSAKSQVEQSIRDIRVRMQIGGASAAFWQKQLQLKTAEYDALDLLASDVGDEEADATCGVSRSIERVWNAFARAEEISSETELLDIIMEMEQGAQSGGASSEFVEMQLKHKMEELQSVQATNASDRERAATRHPVLRGSDAHARAQQVLAESCLINIIQQLKELEHCGGDIADFVQEQLRLKMTELQDLQARKDFAREARRAQSLSQQQAARQASDCRVGISFVRVQRMVAESLLIRLVLNCEEQGQNGG